jgi:diadenosine tetraphosphate (Ap4A) HIT family hydrolase
MCPYCQPLDPARLIADLGSFLWIVGDHQYYPGYSLIVAKRHVREVFELTPAEREAMSEGLASASLAIHRAYSPRKINYAALGNQVDHLHWHLFPRSAEDPRPLDSPWANAEEFARHSTTPSLAREVAHKLREFV